MLTEVDITGNKARHVSQRKQGKCNPILEMSLSQSSCSQQAGDVSHKCSGKSKKGKGTPLASRASCSPLPTMRTSSAYLQPNEKVLRRDANTACWL